MPPLTIPSTAFSAAATILARKSFIVFTPAGSGSPSPLNIVCQKIDIEPTVEYVERKVPVGKYIMTDRKVPKELKFEVKAEVEDVKPVITFFGALPFSRKGTAEVFVCDPDDTSGKVAIHLKSFACEISNDGALSLDGENFAKLNIIITAKEEVQLVIDDDGSTGGGD